MPTTTRYHCWLADGPEAASDCVLLAATAREAAEDFARAWDSWCLDYPGERVVVVEDLAAGVRHTFAVECRPVPEYTAKEKKT